MAIVAPRNFQVNKGNFQVHQVTLAGKTYSDVTYLYKPVKSAYIQCSWFDDKQIAFMETGLEAIGENLTVSLEYSHHPLSHQYKGINVNEHPEVMNDFEWQQATVNMDIEAMKANPLGIALYMPSDPDEGITWESGYLYASHKPNLVVIPNEEVNVPINLMMIGNTQIITIDKLANFDFNKNLIYKPYTGKVFWCNAGQHDTERILNVSVKLFKGDCMKLMSKLPDNSVDLVVTDPPYDVYAGKGGGAFGKRNIYKEIEFMSNGFDEVILDELMRVMKKINIYIFCSQKQIPFLIDYFVHRHACNWNLLTWHKTNPVPACKNKYLSDTEYIFFAREKGVPIYGKYSTKKTYYVTPLNIREKKLYNHPTVKPQMILENLIVNSSKENSIVLDPFVGSGSTGVAAINNNRSFIGIELNEDYFKTAKERIEKANPKQHWFEVHDAMLGWMARVMGKLTIILIMTCGIVEAIMCPFGLADVYNNGDSVKLSKIGWVSIAFDMIEIALVILILIKLF